MNRADYLRELAWALRGRVGEEELRSLLDYYEEYFEDAGPDREEAVIEELGSPAAVAAQVLEAQGSPMGTPPPLRRRSGAVIALAVGLGAMLLLLGLVGVAAINFYTIRQTPSATLVQESALESTVSLVPGSRPVRPVPSVSEERIDATVKDGIAYLDQAGLEAFSKISIRISIGSIIVERGNDYSISMEWHTDSDDLRWSNESGTLKIWSARTGGGRNQRGGSVRVTVPEGALLTDCDLETGLGGIEWKDVLLSGELEASTGLGDIDLSGDITGEADLETGMGDIDVRLRGKADDYALELEAGMGSVKVNGEKVSTDYETRGGSNHLSCTAGMGDIVVRIAP